MKNDGDHGLLSRLAEVTSTSLGSSQSAPRWRAEMGEERMMFGTEACVPLVGPASELRLKKAKLEIVRETLHDHLPLW